MSPLRLHTQSTIPSTRNRQSDCHGALRRTERLSLGPCRVLRGQAQVPAQSEEERVQQARQEVTRRIKLLGQQGKVRDAIQELAGLAKLGVQPDTQAATALVRACTRDMALAQSIFDELFGDFLQPDEVSFAVLLRGYGALDPPDWSRMDATLTTMRQKYDIVPSAVSFNTLLEVAARTNDLDRGQDVIDRMADDGVQPDEFTEETVAKKRSLRSYLRKVFG